MKKNLVSIIILALLIVKIILTSVMLFSTMGTIKKTSNLIAGISTALALELGVEGESAGDAKTVAMENIAVYKIEDQMTIPLAMGADGSSHFCLVSVSLSMDTTAEGYKDYGETIGEKEDLIKGEIVSVISSYSIEEAQPNSDMLREEILKRIQNLYGSEFVYNVVFRDILFQ